MGKTRKQKNVSSVTNKKPVFTFTGWFVCLMIPLLLYAFFTAYMLTKSVKINEKLGCIGYSETGAASYTVTYNDNVEYKNAEYQSGMKYVSSLINKVNTKYNYELHSTGELKYKYSYSITGDIIVYDYVDGNEILKKETENLYGSGEKEHVGQYLVLNEKYDVDFYTYYLKAKKYKANTGVSATAKLVLTFKLDLDISSPDYKDGDKVTRTYTVTIPLTESTIKIDDGEALNTNGTMCQTKAFRISNVALFVTAIVSIVVIFVCLILIIIELNKIIHKDPYRNIVNRILKEYDRLIVSGKYDINESNYSNIIYPTEFEEMVDASINLSEPILFYDIKPNHECHFIIIDDATMYKYVVSRKEIEYQKDKMGDK